MKRIIVLLIIAGYTFMLSAQEFGGDAILMTINDKKITKEEFVRIYKKNNTPDAENKSVLDYLELFINFKLKVIEAENLGMDTASHFIKELIGYRKQLAKPYLSLKNVDDSILAETYRRMLYDIRASHILIKVSENASPQDTLAAYNKIMNARKRILAGEAFDKVAMEISEDQGSKENGGDLGYFTVFHMIYPFETAAYNTKVGEVSMPVRTSFGYHIIKVTDRRKAQGEVEVAHIMAATPKTLSPDEAERKKALIFAIYDSLKMGRNFEELAMAYSDDKGSARNGGKLPPFGTGMMVPEFEAAAFGIKNINDFTEPIQTSYGWHIIKLLYRKNLSSFDEVKNELRTKIARDKLRATLTRSVFIDTLKKRYNYKLASPKALDAINKIVNNSVFAGRWTVVEPNKLNKILFTYDNKTVTILDFARYIEKNQKEEDTISIPMYVSKAFQRFVDETLYNYEDSKLESKYPEFNYLMKEYHDGILLFELTDKMVWSKAIKDTVGLAEFYENNKNKYMWNNRYNAVIYTCANKNVETQLKKMLSAPKPLSTEEIVKKINAKDTTLLKVKTGIFSQGDNDIVDYYLFKDETNPWFKDNKNIYVVTGTLIPPTPKTLQEAKGLVTADYQTYLEEKWIQELRNKYKIEINKDVLFSIK